MTPVDGVASANTLLGFGTWRPGHCLEAVWAAFEANGAVSQVGTVPTAYDAWLRSPEGDRHPGDRNPPAGVPVYWGPKSSSSAGDIVISLGGGQVAATDWPYNGVIGTTTIDQRERQIGRPYLGWTTSILGYPIAFEGAEDMTPEQANQLANIYNAIFFGGPSLPDGGLSIAQSLADLASGVRPTVTRPAADGGTTLNGWIQELADTKTLQLQANEQLATISGGDIDYEALAEALVEQGITTVVIQPPAKRVAS